VCAAELADRVAAAVGGHAPAGGAGGAGDGGVRHGKGRRGAAWRGGAREPHGAAAEAAEEEEEDEEDEEGDALRWARPQRSRADAREPARGEERGGGGAGRPGRGAGGPEDGEPQAPAAAVRRARTLRPRRRPSPEPGAPGGDGDAGAPADTPQRPLLHPAASRRMRFLFRAQTCSGGGHHAGVQRVRPADMHAPIAGDSGDPSGRRASRRLRHAPARIASPSPPRRTSARLRSSCSPNPNASTEPSPPRRALRLTAGAPARAPLQGRPRRDSWDPAPELPAGHAPPLRGSATPLGDAAATPRCSRPEPGLGFSGGPLRTDAGGAAEPAEAGAPAGRVRLRISLNKRPPPPGTAAAPARPRRAAAARPGLYADRGSDGDPGTDPDDLLPEPGRRDAGPPRRAAARRTWRYAELDGGGVSSPEEESPAPRAARSRRAALHPGAYAEQGSDPEADALLERRPPRQHSQQAPSPLRGAGLGAHG